MFARAKLSKTNILKGVPKKGYSQSLFDEFNKFYKIAYNMQNISLTKSSTGKHRVQGVNLSIGIPNSGSDLLGEACIVFLK